MPLLLQSNASGAVLWGVKLQRKNALRWLNSLHKCVQRKLRRRKEEYWRTHTWERWKRDLRSWYRKKTNRETRITGAQRLAEEADEMAKGEQELAEQEEAIAREWENYQDSDEDDDWMPEGGTEL